MRNTLQSHLFERWYEELCRIKINSLKDIVYSNNVRLISNRLLKKGGIYTFWWTGKITMLASNKSNRNIILKGAGGKSIKLLIDDGWLGIESNLPVPLYVGKNASDLSKRIGQHLRLNSKRMFPIGTNIHKRKAPTTSCQLRAGIEHIFPNEKDTRNLILENIGLSYVELHGAEHSANRFYLEDLAIGRMKPVINVDIER